jgi:hypothetical protein
VQNDKDDVDFSNSKNIFQEIINKKSTLNDKEFNWYLASIDKEEIYKIRYIIEKVYQEKIGNDQEITLENVKNDFSQGDCLDLITEFKIDTLKEIVNKGFNSLGI